MSELLKRQKCATGLICTETFSMNALPPSPPGNNLPEPIENVSLVSGKRRQAGSYVVSQDIYWFETIYGKCLHKRTNQRSNHYMRRGGGGSSVTPRT